MTRNEALTAALPIFELFDKLEIPYYVGGSVASSAHGVMRMTSDTDVVADLDNRHIAQIIESLNKDFYVTAIAMREAIARRSSFNLIHFATSTKVDVFVSKNRRYDIAALARRKKMAFDTESDAEIFLASPEDTILSKLEWYRLGDEVSEQQWRDILGVLKAQSGQLDYEYMKKWAAELKVHDLLERIVQEAGVD